MPSCDGLEFNVIVYVSGLHEITSHKVSKDSFTFTNHSMIV